MRELNLVLRKYGERHSVKCIEPSIGRVRLNPKASKENMELVAQGKVLLHSAKIFASTEGST